MVHMNETHVRANLDGFIISNLYDLRIYVARAGVRVYYGWLVEGA